MKNNPSYEELLTELNNLKEFEQQLVHSEKQYRAITQTATDAIITINSDGIIFSWNNAAEKIFGYSSSRIINKNISKIIPAQFKDSHRTAMKRLKNKGKEKLIGKTIEITALRKDGTEFPIEFSLSSWKADNKKYYTGIIRDITERKQVEEQIQEQNIFLNNITESLTHPFYVIDALDYTIKMANSAAGFNSDIEKITCHSLIHQRDKPCQSQEHPCPLEIVKKTKKPTIVEHIHIDKNGNARNIEVHGTPIFDNKGNVIQMIEYSFDITERKRLENTVKESEEKYRTLTENINVGIYRTTPSDKGKFIEVNQAFLNIFGYKDKKSLISQKVSEFYEDPTTREKISQKLESDGFMKNNELRFVKQDGTSIICSDTSVAVKNDEGEIIHYDGIIEDVTERVALRNKLIENEEKYSSIVNNSPDIIMRIDQKGTITYINYKYAGQNPEEVVGKTIYDLMQSEFHDKAKDSLIKVFDTGKSFSYENIGLSHEDEVVWYKNSIGPIRSNGNVIGATIIASDITERKQIDIMKNEFISAVSHELRTPLTIIQESIAQVLEGIYGDLTDVQKEVLSPCMEDINRLNRIINNLLDISKIEGQKILINREMVDIVKLVQNVVASFKNKVAAKNIELKFKTSDEAIEVYIDNDRIIQVFINLIGNAVKFTEKGKIEVSVVKFENSVQCTVSDSGRGILHKDLATVFDRFHQVGKIVSAEEKGTGLGLSISKGIVKLHNGKIWVDSKINKGSQFNFTLPIYTTDEILLENIEKGIVKATKKHIKLSLLIIRLDNFAEIEKNCGLDKAKETTRKVLEAFQDVIAPGEFSFIKGRNEVILFSDITQKNISSIVEKLENILANFISNFSKELDIVMSYGYSIYPNDANSAKDLLQSAYKTLLIKNNYK